MGFYRVLIKPSAAKEIEAIEERYRRRVVERIRRLAHDPRPQGCRKLSGADKYRLCQGPYRVVYLVDDRSRRVVVYRVAHRQGVYD